MEAAPVVAAAAPRSRPRPPRPQPAVAAEPGRRPRRARAAAAEAPAAPRSGRLTVGPGLRDAPPRAHSATSGPARSRNNSAEDAVSSRAPAATPSRLGPTSSEPPEPHLHDVRCNAERSHPHGRHEHQPGRPDRQPDPRSGAALDRRAACRSAACGSPPTPAARTHRPASGTTSPTTSTSPSGAPRARTAPASSRKGRPVALDGRLEWREWETQEGAQAPGVDIVADSVQFLGRPRRGGRRRRRQRLHRLRAATCPSTPATSSRRRSARAAPSGRRRHPVLRPAAVRYGGRGFGRRAAPGAAVEPSGRAAGAARPCRPVLATLRAGLRAGDPPRRRLFQTEVSSWQSSAIASRRAGATRRAVPAAAGASPCPYCRDKIDQVDYKDIATAAPVHLRARQDPLAAHHRRLPAPPEPDRPRRQARPRARAAALRGRGRPRRARAAAAAAVATAIATADHAPGHPAPGRRDARRAAARSSTSRRATCATS